MKDKSYFRKAGKTGVLLVHGCGGTPVEMQYVAHGLYKEGYTVYCPQLAGHGSSSEDLSKSTWQDWYSSVLKAYYFLKNECDSIIIGGLSAGSLLSLKLAIRNRNKIDGIVLYAPALTLNGWAMPKYMSLVRYIKPWMVLKDFNVQEKFPFGIKDERVRNMIVDSMKNDQETDSGQFHTPFRAITQFNALSSMVSKDLSKIEVPILSIHPKNDDIADISNSYKILRNTSGENELIVLNDSYHIITLDKQKNYVIEKTISFIEGLKKSENTRSSYKTKHLRLV
jgi:carboxylesterase